ncbi:TonB-dependent siderophore receptor [Parvularcula sp. LCG005]|uniref:TonB-dependent receptor n=1 Tax=Parvularcula sp. LCG005 TaxID=3078805 RepID=UPI002943AED8|nr:TonB-dependent siderophore receptor [Parvularcula sp. LCG005]WOI52596.1 TonB-dependent siderophore receptor [Parvularcula sp. LCG005]
MKQWLVSSASVLAALSASAFAQETADEDMIIVTGSQVVLGGTYDGDQVSRGARAGLLGNLDYMEQPFSSIGYTEDLLRQQQAISVGDAVRNDPTVRLAKGFGNFQEVFIIRGFPVYSDDMTYNGVYGILPRQFVAAELIERVEVFRGANAFLNGAAPGGSASGGLVNIVPKRAGEEPVTRLTAGLVGQGHLSLAADAGRRFGTDDEFGIRINAVKRDGETAIEGQERDLTVLSLGTDYRGERVRFTFDMGYQDHRIDRPRPQVTPLGDVPEVPGTDANYGQPWTYTDEQQLFGAFRGEVDLTTAVTAWLAVGGRTGEEQNVLANPNATAEGLTTAYRFDNTREDNVVSADTGISWTVATGSIDHRFVASASVIDLESKNAYALSDFINTIPGNLYEINSAAIPANDFFTGGELDNPLTTEETTNTSYALADTLSFIDGRLQATLGLRFQDIETTSFDYNTGAELSSYSADAVTPTVGVVYRATDGISVFGNYAENLRPGAIAPATSGGTPISNAGEILDPFRGEQLEAGVKFDQGSYGGTVSVFTLNQPQSIVDDGVFTDGGEVRVSGLEAVAYGEPVTDLQLIGGFTWLDAELETTDGGLNEGNRPIGVPEFQANLSAQYAVASVPGLSLDSRIMYTGEQYTNTANSVAIDSWTRLDIGAAYSWTVSENELTLRARAENVLNKNYWSSTGGFPGANYLVQGDPRTYLISLSVGL